MVVALILHKRTVMFNRDIFQHFLYFLIRLKQQDESTEK